MSFSYKEAEKLINKLMNNPYDLQLFSDLKALHKPNYQGESKTTDSDGDLVTMTVNKIGDRVEYSRRSHYNDNDGQDDGVFAYKLTLYPTNVWIEALYWKAPTLSDRMKRFLKIK